MARYRVSGTSRVLDHEPGTSFETDLDTAHEQRLVAAGHLVRLADKAEKAAHGKTSDHADDDTSADPKE